VRAETDGGYADLLYSPRTADSDRAIIDAAGAIAEARGVARAQVALAWLRSQPAVTAPLVGASTTAQIDDAVASLQIELTPVGLAALERPYTPRHDFQGISDEAAMQKLRDQIPGYANG
jgi:aryl-alcohol dehydrogenase-like predicted oxidoreductase